jgi:hypothetical protein
MDEEIQSEKADVRIPELSRGKVDGKAHGVFTPVRRVQ